MSEHDDAVKLARRHLEVDHLEALELDTLAFAVIALAERCELVEHDTAEVIAAWLESKRGAAFAGAYAREIRAGEWRAKASK